MLIYWAIFRNMFIAKIFHWVLAEIQVWEVLACLKIHYRCLSAIVKASGDFGMAGVEKSLFKDLFGLWYYMFRIKHVIAIVVSTKMH